MRACEFGTHVGLLFNVKTRCLTIDILDDKDNWVPTITLSLGMERVCKYSNIVI